MEGIERPRVSAETTRIGQEELLGSKFPRNVMPDIVRPPFQDTGPRHDVKAVTGGMLRGCQSQHMRGAEGGVPRQDEAFPVGRWVGNEG